MSIRPLEGATVVAVSGEVDMAVTPELRDEFVRLSSDQCPRIVCDLSEVTFIDSTGLGALIGARKRQLAHDGSFVIAAPSRSVLRIIGLVGLRDVFEIYDNVDEALVGRPES